MLELQKYEQTVTKETAPLEGISLNLLDSAKQQEINSDEDLKQANELKKEINAHAKKVNEQRMSLTRPIDQLKNFIINREREITNPLDEAKANLSKKILDYEEEQERIREAERQRIQEIIDRFDLIINRKDSIEELEKNIASIEEVFEGLDEDDKQHPDIALACSKMVNRYNERISQIKEEERAEAERKRQAEVQAELDRKAKEQSEEQARIDAERAEIEAKERAIEEEKRKLAEEKKKHEQEKEEARLKAEAEAKAKEEAKEIKSRPKSNMVEITKFEVVEPELVHRSLCSPDDTKIRELIKKGAKDIPGVRIWTEKKVR